MGFRSSSVLGDGSIVSLVECETDHALADDPAQIILAARSILDNQNLREDLSKEAVDTHTDRSRLRC